jgi:hypothetical protein
MTQFYDQYLEADADDSLTYVSDRNDSANVTIPSDLTKSGKVKWLRANYPNMTVSEIGKKVGIRYQFAYNVLHKK